MPKCWPSARALCFAALVAIGLPSRGAGQDVTPIILPPPNIIVPNYNGVPTGPLGGLEGSAYVARAADTSAPWLNPAGLAQAGTQLSGSVSTYMLTARRGGSRGLLSVFRSSRPRRGMRAGMPCA